jgi:uncharacterized protein
MKVIALKIKHTIWLGSFCLTVFLPLKSQAITIQEVPNPRQVNATWVTDMAGILDDSTEAQLNSEISQLEAKKCTEIAVVTVPEPAPSASPKEFATALFHYWGIGKKGKDNGVLLLISKGDRRVEIETGYGIEPILPDAKVGNIIDTKITPRFKQGDFNGGTLAGTKALVVALEAPQSSSALPEPTPTATATRTPKTTLTAQPVALEQEPTPGANVPLGVLVGGGLVLAIGGAAAYIRHRKVLLEPEGDSRFRGSNRICLCANCKKRMVKVDNTTVEPTLSKAEKVAQQLGSVRFEGWKCPNCSQQLTGQGFHRVAYESHSAQFRKCPTCEELTVTHVTRTLKHATEYSTGTRLISDKCHCCSYYIEWEETISCLPPPPPPSPPSSGSSSSSSTGSSSSSGDSSGSSSSSGNSGGGSFGGGDSGGGGAGGSW